MLINYTYFQKGLTKISGIKSTNQAADEGQRVELNAMIDIYEPELMYIVFGKPLYDAMITGLAQTNPLAKWTTLRDKLIDSTTLRSPIANYVYFKIWQQTQKISTKSGDKVVSDIGLVASPDMNKAVAINNTMVDLLSTFEQWFDDNTAAYTEWDGTLYHWSTFDYINIHDL